MAPLDPSGERQVIDRVPQIKDFAPEVIVSSPVTRTLHTAAVVLSQVRVPLRVEFQLYDWLPDLRLQRLTMEELRARSSDFNNLKGEWPPGETRSWETYSMMRTRLLSVFSKYIDYQRVLVICHQEPIRSVTGKNTVGMAELVAFDFAPD